MKIFLIVLGLVVIALIIIFRGGTRRTQQCTMDGDQERIRFYFSSWWLEFLRRTHIKDTMCMMLGPNMFADRPINQIPRNYPFHELGGHGRRWQKVRRKYHIFDFPGGRWMWYVIFVVGYLTRNEAHEEESEREMRRLYNNKVPHDLFIPFRFLEEFAEPIWGPEGPPKTLTFEPLNAKGAMPMSNR